MVDELSTIEIETVNGGSQDSYNLGYQIGKAIADTIESIFG